MLQKERIYKHFIFDFDGVIADSYELAVIKYNQIRDEFFPQLPSIRNKHDMSLVYSGYLRNCLDKWIEKEGTKKFFELHTKCMLDSIDKFKLYDGIVEILNGMGERNVSIITSSYSEVVKKALSKSQILFDEKVLYKVSGKEIEQNKAEKILDVISELSLTKEDVIYIGDLENDILYCREIPIDIISVGYGYHPSEYLANLNPTYLVNSVPELNMLMNRISSTN